MQPNVEMCFLYVVITSPSPLPYDPMLVAIQQYCRYDPKP